MLHKFMKIRKDIRGLTVPTKRQTPNCKIGSKQKVLTGINKKTPKKAKIEQINARTCVA